MRLLNGRFPTIKFKLAHVQMVIKAALFQQRVVRALFDDTAVINYQQLVGLLDRAQPVSDDKGGASGHQTQQRFLNLQFCACVDAAGGFVQDEDARIGQDSAGDGQ